jgi:hypothetical protein
VRPADAYGGFVVAELFDRLAVKLGDPTLDRIMGVIAGDLLS